MKSEARPIDRPAHDVPSDRLSRRDEMRPARGLLIGLALSTIFWLALLVLWLAF